MSYDTTKQSVLFENLSKKTVTVKFDQDHASSDGGAVLLKACDEKLELSTTLASCLSDDRQQSKVSHSRQELFQQRLFGIACGHADGNDVARLANNPVMKLMAGRDPITDGSLASQPTLSRFENAARPRDLLRLSEALADSVSLGARRPWRTNGGLTCVGPCHYAAENQGGEGGRGGTENGIGENVVPRRRDRPIARHIGAHRLSGILICREAGRLPSSLLPKRLHTTKPLAESRAFGRHFVQADSGGKARPVNQFIVSGNYTGDSFAWRRLFMVVDIFRGRKF